MERDELSLGNESTAAAMVLNSPGAIGRARTTMAPSGGEVRGAAKAA